MLSTGEKDRQTACMVPVTKTHTNTIGKYFSVTSSSLDLGEGKDYTLA
jgi:hypothetical protein